MVDTVTYRLALPPSLSGVHVVFHVSMLRNYTQNSAHVVDWEEITVDTDGTFEEGLVRILDSRDRVLRRKTVRLMKSVVATQYMPVFVCASMCEFWGRNYVKGERM